MHMTGPTASVPLSPAHAALVHALRAALYREQLYPAPPGQAEVFRVAIEELAHLMLGADELARFTWEDGRLTGVLPQDRPAKKRRKPR